MKKILWIIIYIGLWGNIHAAPIQFEINQGWKFKQARLSNWYPATVPGVVHTDLLDNGIIEDPFFRLNERGLQWIDKEDWIYETSFDLPKDLYNKKNIQILFKGLDTYADVYLNDEKILAANNMFRRWIVDVKSLLREEKNILRVYFHSPIKIDMPKWDALPFPYMGGNDQSENGGVFDKKLSVLARKAGYHYGWDWGPRLVTSGIWRPIIIEAWDNARIENIQIIQEKVSTKEAKIKTIVEVISDTAYKDAIINLIDVDSKREFIKVPANLQKGMNKINLEFIIKKPKLWWSNGLGEAHLYNFQTSLLLNNKEIDKQENKVGIRSIELINEDDEFGKSFYFKLNGVPVFMKGANTIPNDNFLPRVTKEIYEKMVLDAVNANMNMLTVWGGGIYEDDSFYDLCDKYGIFVWQYFMFSCSFYPAEGELLENIRLEAVDNIRRLRNHSCIAIWCGNNEVEDAWFGWGWKRIYGEKYPQAVDVIWNQIDTLFHKILPAIIHEQGSGIAYTPTSPYSRYGQLGNDHEGDRHYWSVWHQKKPISDYNVERARFFSEYGFQSFPEFESVKIYAPEEKDWNITSEVMMSHQRGGEHANKLIESYLLNEYYKPNDFRSFIYVGQLLQGDAVKTAIEAHRRDKGYCMGTLFWQHNDCWPVASWSSRDYYGRWKAQHYFAREAYKDILVSPIEKNGLLNVYLVSDRLKDRKGKLTLKVINLNGGVINEVEKQVTLKANSSNIVFSQNTDKLLKGYLRNEIVIHAVFSSGNDLYSNNYVLLKQKEMNYPKPVITKSIKKNKDGFEVTLFSDKFARGVFLSIDGIDNFFEDNYFDLLPNETKNIKVKTNLSVSDFVNQLKLISLKNIY